MGDIVLLKLGAKVPADVRLIEVSSDVKFDRSILTGESVAVGATVDSTNENFMETKNIALQGTLCTEGSAVGVVVGRGNDTIFGRIAKAAGGKRPVRSTLEVEIARFVLISAGAPFAIDRSFWLRFFHTQSPVWPCLSSPSSSVRRLFLSSQARKLTIAPTVFWAAFLRRRHPGFINVPTLIVDCVSVAVAFIPEGLPFCVTMSLTVIVRPARVAVRP